jgi:hypothetical protein
MLVVRSVRRGGVRPHCQPRVSSRSGPPANVEMAFVAARGAPALVARVAPGRAPASASPTKRAGARSASRAHRVAPRAVQTETDAETTSASAPSSGDAFDDPLATQFKRMYATPGTRIKWGVFKEDVGEVTSARGGASSGECSRASRSRSRRLRSRRTSPRPLAH